MAGLRDYRCKNSAQIIARSLEGHYRPEHRFHLRQAMELFEVYQTKSADCDLQIRELLATFDTRCKAQPLPKPHRPRKAHRNEPKFNLRDDLYRL